MEGDLSLTDPLENIQETIVAKQTAQHADTIGEVSVHSVFSRYQVRTILSQDEESRATCCQE